MNAEKITQRFSTWLPSKGNVLFALILGAMFWTQGYAENLRSGGWADSTNTISYQGFLTDSNSTPLTAAVDITFRIYAELTGGTPLWEETWTGDNAVQVTNGLFNVSLGLLNTDLVSVIQSQSDLYLGVSIGTDETEIAPRPRFGSAISTIQTMIILENSITRDMLVVDIFQPQQTDTITSYWAVPACQGAGESGDFFFEVPNLSLQISLNKPSTVEVNANGMFANYEAAKKIYAVLYVNGQELRYAEGERKLSGIRNGSTVDGSPNWGSFSHSEFLDLPAGDHTVDVRVYCNGSDTAGIVHGGTLKAKVLP